MNTVQVAIYSTDVKSNGALDTLVVKCLVCHLNMGNLMDFKLGTFLIWSSSSSKLHTMYKLFMSGGQYFYGNVKLSRGVLGKIRYIYYKARCTSQNVASSLVNLYRLAPIMLLTPF